MSANGDLSKEQMNQLAAVFRAEALEHVKRLAEILFSLEEDTAELSAKLSIAFREAHSLKGSAGTLGFERIATLTHRFEDALGAIRDGKTGFDDRVLDLMLETLEVIRSAVVSSMPGETELSADEREALEALDRLLKVSSAPRPARTRSSIPAPDAPAGAEDDRRQPQDEPRRQEFIRVAEDRIDTVLARFGELFETGIQLESLGYGLARNAREADRMSTAIYALLQRLEGSELESDAMELYDLARNLLIMLKDSSKRFDTEERQLSKLIQRTQESLREIRMAPVSMMFVTIRSQVREAARATGKQVEVQLDGGEYTVDRTVLDSIEDPIIHIIRNAVDHGIEPPEERRRSGKPERGRISVAVRHTGDSVEMSITDDGKGINPETIRATLRDKYSVPQAQIEELTDDQLLDYLFESGFSTQQGVTKISGRGVGLDVVKHTIEKFGGEVRLNSVFGKGTEISLRLPLTMSTLRCLLLKCSGRPLAIPSSNVEKVLVLREDDLRQVGGGNVIRFEDQNVPISPLEDILYPGTDETAKRLAASRFAAVVRFGDRRFAFGIEEISEYAQLVMKPLGDLLGRVPNVSGLSLLGTGETTLILNPADLIRSAGGITARSSTATLKAVSEAIGALTVLVVDDSIATQTLEKTLLESAGYRVLTASDGLQALTVLAEHPCDLVISDVQMPNMDGFELTKTIKSRAGLSHLPVILITSLGSKEDMAAGLAAGADAHIVKKELTRSELVKTISQLL